MSAIAFLELERLSRVAPLGVRFWDRPTARAVSEGLLLTNVESARRALVNRSDVFVLQGLPGMQAAEYGAGDEDYWASPPVSRKLTLELVDALGRFHDVRFDAEAPFRDVFGEDCGFVSSPPDAGAQSVPLFSLPSRPVPAATAAVRAELTDSETGEPASWAVLEVTAQDVGTLRGIADRQGRVLVLLPYPEPPWHGPSPPAGSRPLSAQSWPVGLSVRYSPGEASPPLPGPDDREPPDLCSVLLQEPATLASDESPTVPVDSDELVFGRELVLNQGERRTLLVTPAA
jgi:hypothetical protein